ncbi:hypothetical protein KSZ_66520 [Dictyobacter formicarum]|uniref:Uncharacterized protein n=1 Tax=Dictyobacter formicarum TaxID=2778368 RepID=A0ABQ3VTK5_9CHLR|nr:hypothetical protein KSZ_66520 [Dictyobacter formicarum]
MIRNRHARDSSSNIGNFLFKVCANVLLHTPILTLDMQPHQYYRTTLPGVIERTPNTKALIARDGRTLNLNHETVDHVPGMINRFVV